MQSTVIQIMTGYKYNFKLKVIILIFFKFSITFLMLFVYKINVVGTVKPLFCIEYLRLISY